MSLIKLLGAGTILVSSFMTFEALAWTQIGECTNSKGDRWQVKKDGSYGKLKKNGAKWKEYDPVSKRNPNSTTHGWEIAERVFNEKCAL